MTYWEIIADNLSKAGWRLGWVSAVDSQGRPIWIADAHRGGKRFIVPADEKLTAFLELEAAVRNRQSTPATEEHETDTHRKSAWFRIVRSPEKSS